MQKHVHLVALVKSFPTSIYLQNLASIQERTSPCEIDSRLQNCRIAGVRQNIGAAPGARPAPAAPGGPGEDRRRAEGPGPSELGIDYYFLYLRKLAQTKGSFFRILEDSCNSFCNRLWLVLRCIKAIFHFMKNAILAIFIEFNLLYIFDINDLSVINNIVWCLS